MCDESGIESEERNRIMSNKSVCLAYVTVALLVCAAGVAWAEAVRVQLSPVHPDYLDASGQATLVYVQSRDETQVVVTCWGLMPETMYDVRFGMLMVPVITEFTTNRNGGGIMRVTLDGDRWLSLPVSVRYRGVETVLLGP